MKQLYQLALVVISTALGAAFGRYVLLLAVAPLARHIPASPESPKHDFGDAFAFFMNYGYNLGLLVGIFMTVAVMGGLLTGIVLARRVGKPSKPTPAFGLKAA